jgi:hypothetical protein
MATLLNTGKVRAAIVRYNVPTDRRLAHPQALELAPNQRVWVKEDGGFRDPNTLKIWANVKVVDTGIFGTIEANALILGHE